MPVLSVCANIQCDGCGGIYTGINLPVDDGPYGDVLSAALDAARDWQVADGKCLSVIGERVLCPACTTAHIAATSQPDDDHYRKIAAERIAALAQSSREFSEWVDRRNADILNEPFDPPTKAQ